MTETTRNRVPMASSGFCAFPSTPDHAGCVNNTCTCHCHRKDM